MIRQLTPGCLDHLARLAQMGHAVNDFAEQTLPVLNAYRHIIGSRLAVIVAAKPHSLAIKRFRVISLVHTRIVSDVSSKMEFPCRAGLRARPGCRTTKMVVGRGGG